MRIEVFNVGHGQCAVITAPNGRRMMLDCGDRWGDDRFWTPSLHFFRQTIDLLALMNLSRRGPPQGLQERDARTARSPWILSNPTIGHQARAGRSAASAFAGSVLSAVVIILQIPPG